MKKGLKTQGSILREWGMKGWPGVDGRSCPQAPMEFTNLFLSNLTVFAKSTRINR